MATLVQIRTQCYGLLRETSSDTQFGDTQINSFINQSIKLASPIIELPRKFSSGTQGVQGQGAYAVPSDFIALRTAYYGDETVSGKSYPLKFIREETLKEIHPSWRDTSASAQGRPRYIFFRDQSTFYIFPTPDALAATTGNKLIYNYIYQATDLSADSDIPSLPLPYHDILKFYTCHLAYLNIGNKDMAKMMFDEFIASHKSIQAISITESKEAMAFQWGYSDEVNDSLYGDTIIP